MPEGREELGEIKYVLTNQQEMDESCKNFNGNDDILMKESGKIYSNEDQLKGVRTYQYEFKESLAKES